MGSLSRIYWDVSTFHGVICHSPKAFAANPEALEVFGDA